MVANENNSTGHCLYDVIDAINSYHFVEKDESTISDILLWAIFANRKELAEICWLRSENHLCKLNFFLNMRVVQKVSERMKFQFINNDVFLGKYYNILK